LTGDFLKPGLHEALLTRRLKLLLAELPDETLVPEVAELRDAEASDRMSRHLAAILARAIERAPEGKRSEEALRIAAALIHRLQTLTDGKGDPSRDEPVEPGQVLVALLKRLPDGRPQQIERPLTPLLDTTVFTNAPGEPAVGHELRAEVPSADGIDFVMAFIRWSGVRPLVEALRRHCEAGKPLRVLTTTYTNSTEQRALDELERLGAQIKVSYDTSSTRLHAKAWIFHRETGYSTAYIRLLQPHAFRTGARSRVERSRLGRTESRCDLEDGSGLRKLLGKQRVRALRPRRIRATHSGSRC
jgi:hypothetical protein